MPPDLSLHHAILAEATRAFIVFSHPLCVVAMLAAILAIVGMLQRVRFSAPLFRFVPALVFYYFLPTVVSMAGLLPRESPVYGWVKTYILAASLCLLTLALDLRAIIRLGRTALAVFAASCLSIMIGGPISLAIWKSSLPPDAWKAMAWLAGSWIGGAANAVALTSSFHVSDEAAAPLIVVDVIIAYAWMAVLLILAARHKRVDRWLRADPAKVASLETRVTRETPSRDASRRWAWFTVITVFGLIVAIASAAAASAWVRSSPGRMLVGFLDVAAWRVILATTLGVLLSLTPARELESRGASRVGMAMLYLLVACIGAGADLSTLRHAGGYLALGATWMLIHIVILFAVGRLLKAPFFFLAVSSQSNIGGPVSAPIVAAAFNPALAPVGVLLAIAGYVVGTYLGLLCIHLCRLV
ncbi:MAG: DUF819 family protein [Planctomycetes bacterium]|nr:DUF819 family protein [Planctomycetota bacterium]